MGKTKRFDCINRQAKLIGASSLIALLIVLMIGGAVAAEPPFGGTIFLDPDIIKATDPTSFRELTYAGQGMRTMFDRRSNGWDENNAYLFNAVFDDGLTIEIQVNPEFGNSDAAMLEARKYAPIIGRLPTVLRLHVETVWIHKGNQPFGGGNNNLLIHTGQADDYEADGILEETLVHEASHTSLDSSHAYNTDWRAAQEADGEFISTYARDNPYREDIAESFLLYYAFRYKPNRIDQSLKDTIQDVMPNRIAYFDENIELYPEISQTGDLVVDVSLAKHRVLFDEAHGGSFTVNETTDHPLEYVIDTRAFYPEYGWISQNEPITAAELADAFAVAFVAPEIDLNGDEAAALEQFLSSGGNVLFFGNRGYVPPAGFAALLGEFGVTLSTTCWIDDGVIIPTRLTEAYDVVDGQCLTIQTTEGIEIAMRSRCRMTNRAEWAFAILKRGSGHLVVLGDETFNHPRDTTPGYQPSRNPEFVTVILDYLAAQLQN